jgi:hypothetical protein
MEIFCVYDVLEKLKMSRPIGGQGSHLGFLPVAIVIIVKCQQSNFFSYIMASSCQIKNYKTSICCFSAKQAALRRKSKDWLAWNQYNVSEWSDMSTRGLLFQ